MKQKTEWQVVLNHGDEVLTDLTKAEAVKEFQINPKANELRKVIWTIKNNESWELDEPEREEIVMREKG